MLIPVSYNGNLVLDSMYQVDSVDIITLGMSKRPVPVFAQGRECGTATNKGRLIHFEVDGFKIVAPSKYLIPLLTNEIGSINCQVMPDEVN